MKKIILFFLVLKLFSFSAKAEIVYIDINLILKKSEVGISLNNYIQKIKKDNSTVYEKIENDLKQKEKSLIAQQNILNKDEFEKKLKILTNEVKKYRSDKKNSIEKLNNIKIDKTKKILEVLNPIITKYVDLNSISIVMPKKNIIVGKKNLDITLPILKVLDKSVQKINFDE